MLSSPSPHCHVVITQSSFSYSPSCRRSFVLSPSGPCTCCNFHTNSDVYIYFPFSLILSSMNSPKCFYTICVSTVLSSSLLFYPHLTSIFSMLFRYHFLPFFIPHPFSSSTSTSPPPLSSSDESVYDILQNECGLQQS